MNELLPHPSTYCLKPPILAERLLFLHLPLAPQLAFGSLPTCQHPDASAWQSYLQHLEAVEYECQVI
jgi:hypothetical protein